MSNFPSPPGKPQGLNQTLFDECYNVLTQKIRDETPMIYKPHPGKEVTDPPTPDKTLWQQEVDEATSDLSHWQSYAIDGDVSMLDVSMISSKPDGPWMILVDSGNELIHTARADMENAVGDMRHVWSGQAHRQAEGYIQTTADLVEGYCPSTSDNKSGIVNQAATVLQGAYATAVAFKQDLYNLAMHASHALDKLDGGAGDSEPVWLIVAAVGIALTGAGGAVEAAVAASSGAVTAAFEGGLLAGLGGLVINQATPQGKDANSSPEYIGGRDPKEIMRSLAKATDEAVSQYQIAASKAGLALSTIWYDIDSKMNHAMARPQPDAAPNVSINTSQQMSRLLPDE